MARLGNWILLTVTIIVCLLVGEVLVRFTLGDQLNLFPRYHAEARYGDFTIRRLRPNTEFWHTSVDGTWQYVTNSQGFRSDRDFTYEKPAGTLRVLALGDSQTQGAEARQDHTFSAVIERYLKAQGTEAEVINAGVSGFGTAEALILLENEGIRYAPDVVVLGFFKNDFADNVRTGLFTVDDGALKLQKNHYAPAVRFLGIHNSLPPLRWLSENSYLYSLGTNTVWELAKQGLLSRERARLATEFAIPADEVTAHEQELALRLLERMYRFCQENGILLIVLDIPERTGPFDFGPSIPPDLRPAFANNSDVLIGSEELFAAYRHVGALHVPNGHHHISELTHLLFGLAVGQAIEEFVPPEDRPGPDISASR